MANKCLKKYSASLVTREMQIKTIRRYHFMLIKIAIIENIKNKDKKLQVSRMWKKRNPHAVDNVKWCTCCGKQFGGSSVVKQRFAIWPSNSYCYLKFKVLVHEYSQQQDSKAKRWPINGWLNKMWYKHIKGYYSALKRSEIMTHATTWTLKSLCMQNEKRQTQEDK